MFASARELTLITLSLKQTTLILILIRLVSVYLNARSRLDDESHVLNSFGFSLILDYT